MLRYALLFLLLVHGAIHLMGFAKAFGFGQVPQLTKAISKPLGWCWLLAALLLLATALLFALRKETWWLPGLAGVLLSQVLIITTWSDARYGTIANVLLLLALVLAIGSWRFEHGFRRDVGAAIASRPASNSLVTESDLAHLPAPVRNYLRYAGVVGRPQVRNYSIRFKGSMRSRKQDWFEFGSEQYNFCEQPTRFFFMKAKMKGVTVPGYHAYRNGKASMQIRAFGLIPVANQQGPQLDKAETVTIFNDLCLFAPAALIDTAIRWQEIDAHAARARFTVGTVTISADLIFNDKGELINFISDDRYEVNEGKFHRFSTPVSNYRDFGGYRLPAYGEAVWHYPDGLFTYGKFQVQEIRYNVSD